MTPASENKVLKTKKVQFQVMFYTITKLNVVQRFFFFFFLNISFYLNLQTFFLMYVWIKFFSSIKICSILIAIKFYVQKNSIFFLKKEIEKKYEKIYS